MIEIVQGDSFTFEESIENQSGAVVVLDNGTVEFTIIEPGNTVRKATGTIVDASKGICQLELSGTDTLKLGFYTYRPKVMFPNNKNYSSISKKAFRVIPE